MALPPMPSGSALDGPPPSPTPMAPPPEGGGFSAGGLAPSMVPTDQMPPEVIQGIMQSAQTIAALLDSFAQVTPDKGAQLALIKDLLQRYLAELTMAGAGPISPTAPGPAFPGGGIDRGIAGPGSV